MEHPVGKNLGRTMRVLMVTEIYPPLSDRLEFHVQSLAVELTRRGHDIRVATLGHESDTTVQDGIVVHRIRSSASRINLLYARFHTAVPPTSEWTRGFADTSGDSCTASTRCRAWPQLDGCVLPAGYGRLTLTSHDYAVPCPKFTLTRSDRSLWTGPRLTLCTPVVATDIPASRELARLVPDRTHFLPSSHSRAEVALAIHHELDAPRMPPRIGELPTWPELTEKCLPFHRNAIQPPISPLVTTKRFTP